MTSEAAPGVPRAALAGKFISIRPELVKVCGGANEALVVALIDYRTRPEYKTAHLDADGTVWWPVTVQAIADDTGLTLEQARYSLKRAVERGLLDTTHHHLRGDNYDRTKSYRVVYAGSAHLGNTPDEGGEVSQMRGGEIPKSGVSKFPNPSFYEEQKEEVKEERASDDAVVVAVVVDPFDEFWAEYPIRKGKKPARLAYEKALKRAPAEVILAGVRAYVASLGPNPDPSKVKWAQGWLNDDRWNDEHTAPAVPAAIANSKQATTLQLMQHYAAEEGGQLDEEGDHRALARGAGGR